MKSVIQQYQIHRYRSVGRAILWRFIFGKLARKESARRGSEPWSAFWAAQASKLKKLKWHSQGCMAMRHSRFLPSRNGERVACRGEQSSEMTHDGKDPPILIWHRWLPILFKNDLFSHAKCYADISGSRKRPFSHLWRTYSCSKSFIFDGFHISSRRTEHEGLKSCHVASISWNTPALPSNELCEFLERG
jgi:hypothetical protein